MKSLTRLFVISLLGLGALSAQAQSSNPATTSVPRNDWIARHEGFNAIAKKGGVDLLFLRDSITDGRFGRVSFLSAATYSNFHHRFHE
jgi:hypothetical protein